MRALVCHGPGSHSWEEMAKPTLQGETDAIVAVDAVTSYGTDLYIPKGDVPAVTDRRILGHGVFSRAADTGALKVVLSRAG